MSGFVLCLIVCMSYLDVCGVSVYVSFVSCLGVYMCLGVGVHGCGFVSLLCVGVYFVVWWGHVPSTTLFMWCAVQEGWDTVLGLSQQPVRCEVRGRIHSDHSPKDFHHVYEVTEFYEYLDGGPTVFEVRTLSVCLTV